MDPLQDITRRHFFSNCARRRRLDRAWLAPRPRSGSRRRNLADRIRKLPGPHFPPRRRTSSTSSWPAGQPARTLRLQAQARRAERQADPRSTSRANASPSWTALQTAKHPARHPAEVRPARQERRPTSPSSSPTPPRSSTTSPSSRPSRPTSSTNAPAKLFMNTGSSQFGRPSMGTWVTYGIGSKAMNGQVCRNKAIAGAQKCWAVSRGRVDLPSGHVSTQGLRPTPSRWWPMTTVAATFEQVACSSVLGLEASAAGTTRGRRGGRDEVDDDLQAEVVRGRAGCRNRRATEARVDAGVGGRGEPGLCRGGGRLVNRDASTPRSRRVLGAG